VHWNNEKYTQTVPLKHRKSIEKKGKKKAIDGVYVDKDVTVMGFPRCDPYIFSP